LFLKEMSTLNNSINEHKAADNLILRKVAAALAAIVLLIVAVVMTYQGAQKNVALLVDGQRHEVKTFGRANKGQPVHLLLHYMT